MLKPTTFGPAMSAVNSRRIPGFEDMVASAAGEKTSEQQSLVVKGQQTYLGRRNLTKLLKGWMYLGKPRGCPTQWASFSVDGFQIHG